MKQIDYATQKNLNKIDLQSLLSTAIENGIINISDVQEKIEMTKRENYLNLHKQSYKTWQGTDGKWRTYLPDASKKDGRRLVKKVTEEKLNDAIVEYYQSQEKQSKSKKITLRTWYQTWLDYKKLQTRSTMYIRRIASDWDNYYQNDSLIDIPLTQLDYDVLQEWALKKVRIHELTKKQYYNMTVIIRQSLDYAVQKKKIVENPFSNVRIDSKLFKIKKKPEDETQVFLLDEQPQIEAEAYRDFQETGYSACLAIPFAFQTGLRLGEIVAIKESDIKDDYIHIQRMEIREVEQLPDGTWSTQRFKVVDYTKSEAGDRWVYLSSKAKEILKRVLENNKEQGFYDNGFLFLNRDGRIHSKGVDCRIRKYCRHIGIMEKATHKIRKSYISTLIDSGLNINEIRKQAGHEDERTTYGNYCYNRLSNTQTESILEKALCG